VRETPAFPSRPLLATVVAMVSMVAVAALPVVAGAQATPAQQSAVSTSFVAPFFFGSFNAVSDAGGANPSGQVSYHLGGGLGSNTTATVVCLSVSGNTAVIGFVGTIDDPFPPPPQRVVGELVVADNAPGPTFLDTVALSQRITDTGPANCSAPGPLTIGPLNLMSGDIVVTAAPPLPTSKGQCKNSGWRNFPGFKNEGACVSFVATGGKTPPGS
jgi:hypothetical protein